MAWNSFQAFQMMISLSLRAWLFYLLKSRIAWSSFYNLSYIIFFLGNFYFSSFSLWLVCLLNFLFPKFLYFKFFFLPYFFFLIKNNKKNRNQFKKKKKIYCSFVNFYFFSFFKISLFYRRYVYLVYTNSFVLYLAFRAFFN